ncbi:hypothetical protein [Methanoregula sp.]|uniref:hypothetical protein n=1 Tax=Methanoregula sp. TaxID=2052170 RepID=UPI00356743B0
MKLRKLSLVLLALLLAAMAMVPMVSAGELQKNNLNETMDPNADPEIISILQIASVEEHIPLNEQTVTTIQQAKVDKRSYLENYVSPSKKIITLMEKKGTRILKSPICYRKTDTGGIPGQEPAGKAHLQPLRNKKILI